MSPGTVHCVFTKLIFVMNSLTGWFSDKLANQRSPCLRVFLRKQYNCIRVNDNLLLRLRKPAMTRYPEALPQFPPSLIFMQDQFCGYPWYCVRGSHVACFLDISRPNVCICIFDSHRSCYIFCPSALHGVDDETILCEVYKLQSLCCFALHTDTFTFLDPNYNILNTL